MVEQIKIPPAADKEQKFQALIPQIKSLVSVEDDLIANLSNMAAALKEAMDYFWVGFYLVKGNELVLGPFQGPVACTRIGRGKGVCGTAWEQRKVIIVPDIQQFPGHISCNVASKSEIVLPVFHKEEVIMILDVDSDRLNDFDSVDAHYLGQITELIAPIET